MFYKLYEGLLQGVEYKGLERVGAGSWAKLVPPGGLPYFKGGTEPKPFFEWEDTTQKTAREALRDRTDFEEKELHGV